MSSPDPIMGAMGHATSAMQAQSLRMRLAAENLSNADTPGYHRKTVSFRAEADGVMPGRVRLDTKEGRRIHDPSHPLADENGLVTLSNVDMMIEMADAREAGRSYDANLQVFGQAKRLYEGLLSILKR